MIKKININNLGLYKNFKWDSVVRIQPGNNIAELKKENIFYGRNYSGKTTLSRIIRALETKEISSKYLDPDFEIIMTDNTRINQSNFQENLLSVRCFNEDFIKENLSFVINSDSEIKPFAILGENNEIELQIEAIINELGDKTEGSQTLKYKELVDISEALNKKSTEIEQLKSSLDSQLTDKATGHEDSIKKQHLKFGDINYDKRKLKQDIDLVLKSSYIPIDGSKEVVNLQQINEVQKENIFHSFHFNNLYEQEIAGAVAILGQPLLDGNKIAELLSNSDLNIWVKKGYEIHSDDKNNNCQFCGNTIKESRWFELESHFDEESKKMEESLQLLHTKISKEIANTTKYKLPERDSFYFTFHEELKHCSELFDTQILNYKKDLDFLLSKIDKRILNLHVPVEYEYIPTFSQDNLTASTKCYNDIEKRNNAYSSQLSDNISQAKKELKLLEVKKFIDTILYTTQLENINDKEKAYLSEKAEQKQLANYIKLNENKILELSSQLNNEEEGAKKVNLYLQNYFGHQNLKLQAVEEEAASDKKIKFNIVRNGVIAYHLSEGECSIISFCYFMAKLDDVNTAGKKPIILIDDPISSLDSNHIFYIYSLINSELFIKDRFEQIIISTHNLDFLKYLKRLKLTRNQHEYFIINRYKEYSEIAVMPNYLKNYVTEFNFLFEQIYKCANSQTVTDENHHIYYNFGNNARKFLEALLFYKYPSKIDNQTNNANSKRLLKYFGDDQQAATLTDRVNNELSHLEEIFDRGMNPMEIPEQKKVAQFILEKMKSKDHEQYAALLESIGVESEVE